MLLPFCDNRQLYKWDKSKCTEPLTKSLTCFERSQKIVHALMVATKKNQKKLLHFVLASCSQHISQAVFLVCPKTVVWSVRNFEWLGLMREKRCPSWSHRDSMASDSFGQSGACVLRWEGPDVGVWHFLRTYSQTELCPWTLEKMQQKYLANYVTVTMKELLLAKIWPSWIPMSLTFVVSCSRLAAAVRVGGCQLKTNQTQNKQKRVKHL